MCDGAQVICSGVHPDTKALYRWHGGTPGDDFKRADLALIDGHQAKRLLDDLVEMLIRDFGYIRKPPKTKPTPPAGAGQTRSGQRGDWAIDFSDHAACASLAMRLLKSGMSDATAVNFLRDNIEKLTNVDEERRARRLKEIPGMVSTARFKLDGNKPAPDPSDPPPARTRTVTVDDLRGYMPTATFIFMPAGELWPAKSVNARVPPVVVGINEKGEPIRVAASTWIMREQPCEQMVWAPKEPQIISDRLITKGGWIDHHGANVFNLYHPPTLKLGDPNKAGKWRDHIKLVYPNDAERIEKWLAQRVQNPHIKINHALVLGGPQGVGKDTLLEPVKRAVGPWNFQEVSPQQTLGRFNGFLPSVILRISEVRDMGEVNRFSFYEHLKAYTAAPPDTLRVDEKNLREYYVLNVVGIVMTTNNKMNGIFLPADDRRHYVAWTELKKEDFDLNYWIDLWSWYDQGGDAHVAAYLAATDLSDFNPKAPPPKTPAFWDIVDSGRVSEDAELADIIDALGGGLKDAKGNLRPPLAFAMSSVLETAIFLSGKDLDGYPRRDSFAAWLADRKHRRLIPHRFESCGYSPVRNAAVDDGLWKVGGKRQVIYARADLPVNDRRVAAELVIKKGAPVLSLPVRR